jgi:hypothetical protein
MVPPAGASSALPSVRHACASIEQEVCQIGGGPRGGAIPVAMGEKEGEG